MSMDRRHFDAREGSSTSKEVNSGLEKTNGSRDMVKDTYKKTEEFKLEKFKLEKAWKEQKECNEDLTRHIKTDKWDQSTKRLIAYLKTFQDKELKNKTSDSSNKVLMTQSEIQEHNLSSQSFQKSLQEQIGCLSERSFQNCLQKGDLEKAREHIEKLKTINENFRDSLVELGVTLTTESRSIDKENQNLKQEIIDEIKPKDVKLSRLAQIKDALIGPHEHRPERVNNITAKFKENVNYIKQQIDSDSLPENLKGKLIEMTLSFIHDFKKFSAQAVRGYGEGSKGQQSRRDGEASINDLNQRIQKMGQYLPMWEDINKFQDSIKNAPASSSNDTIPDIEQLVANKVVDDLKQAHMRVLHCYRRPSDSPLFETLLQNAHNNLDKSYDQFKILSYHSDEWRQVNNVRAQLEADHGEATQEDMRIKLLADKAIHRAKEAYKEVLDWHQQSGGRPEHLHGTYKQLEEAGEQLETLREASHVWKQINEIQTEFVGDLSESNKKLANREVQKAKDAFKNFLDRYEQGNDRQISKQSLERACKSLKDIITENDLREDWSNEVKVYDNLLEDVSKTHNNMEIFAFVEEEDRKHLENLMHTSLKDKNFAKAREYINQLKEVNDYLEEMKQQGNSSLPDSGDWR